MFEVYFMFVINVAHRELGKMVTVLWRFYTYINIYLCVCVCIYIYIYMFFFINLELAGYITGTLNATLYLW